MTLRRFIIRALLPMHLFILFVTLLVAAVAGFYKSSVDESISVLASAVLAYAFFLVGIIATIRGELHKAITE